MATIADLVNISYVDSPVSDGVVTGADFWNTDILDDIKTQFNITNSVVTDEIGTDKTAGTARFRIAANEADIVTLNAYLNQAVKTTSRPTFASLIINAVTANGKSAATVEYVNAAIAGGAGKASQAEVSAATDNIKYMTSLSAAVLAQLAGAAFTGSVSIAGGQALTVDTINQKTTATGVTIETMLVKAGVVTGLSTLTATALTGTLQTAAQANITSLGTLSALTMGGTLAMGAQAITGGTITGGDASG